MTIGAHFFDEDHEKIGILREKTQLYRTKLPTLRLEVEPWPFDVSFAKLRSILANHGAAKLVLIDQYGVDDVSDDRFKELVSFPHV